MKSPFPLTLHKGKKATGHIRGRVKEREEWKRKEERDGSGGERWSRRREMEQDGKKSTEYGVLVSSVL